MIPAQFYRKVIGIAIEQRDDSDRGGLLYVACDDGAVFYRNSNGSEWEEDTPIPGSIRDIALKGQAVQS